jgi:hypothetical protein
MLFTLTQKLYLDSSENLTLQLLSWCFLLELARRVPLSNYSMIGTDTVYGGSPTLGLLFAINPVSDPFGGHSTGGDYCAFFLNAYHCRSSA